ncbi:hypothetical protein DAPPUDRAFT_233375 [Daphnia pulex]|uniref:Uncharacterized protein n=1 Tax=Daphnia pulex TaxID=6669 RepID=E9FTX2_DAPPU|nr:hypothetical protein DAPPUDRAFT_233375 [Daphnia pulex]|eukprot:EFX89566.1 hypothetical protein DAPPUDRAFT_233375 [Daphnia pulex]
MLLLAACTGRMSQPMQKHFTAEVTSEYDLQAVGWRCEQVSYCIQFVVLLLSVPNVLFRQIDFTFAVRVSWIFPLFTTILNIAILTTTSATKHQDDWMKNTHPQKLQPEKGKLHFLFARRSRRSLRKTCHATAERLGEDDTCFIIIKQFVIIIKYDVVLLLIVVLKYHTFKPPEYYTTTYVALS